MHSNYFTETKDKAERPLNTLYTYVARIYLILRLVKIVDPLEWDHCGGVVVAQSTEDHSIPQSLLQLCCRGQLVLNTRLYPSVKRGEDKR